ncbi:hypothetical protein ARTHRO9AX_10306 [Arthrobacter sp. 9AX]|nr:hypothetical protein ARTHRO9AX_10306 [Arthrobacter sp. 9AX]
MKTQLLPTPPASKGFREPALPFVSEYRRRMLRADLLTVITWASVVAAGALVVRRRCCRHQLPASAFTAAGIVAGLAGMDLVSSAPLTALRQRGRPYGRATTYGHHDGPVH